MAMKGAWRTFEAIAGGMLVLVFLAALMAVRYQAPQAQPAQGRSALDSAYGEPEFRALASGMNATGIAALIGSRGLAAGYNLSVRVCAQGGQCAGSMPGGDNVWASSVLVSGDGSYSPCEVTLYIYRSSA